MLWTGNASISDIHAPKYYINRRQLRHIHKWRIEQSKTLVCVYISKSICKFNLHLALNVNLNHSIMVIITHEVSKASYRQTTGTGDKLQQPHPLLIVHFLYKLQDKVIRCSKHSTCRHSTSRIIKRIIKGLFFFFFLHLCFSLWHSQQSVMCSQKIAVIEILSIQMIVCIHWTFVNGYGPDWLGVYSHTACLEQFLQRIKRVVPAHLLYATKV